MELREFFSEDAIELDLVGTTKDDILRELISLLKLDEKSEGMLFKMLKRRENLGSTGIGRGIAIPHCRSLVVNNRRVAARGLEPMPAGAREDRAVQQGARFSGASPRSHRAKAVPRTARRKGRVAVLPRPALPIVRRYRRTAA